MGRYPVTVGSASLRCEDGGLGRVKSWNCNASQRKASVYLSVGSRVEVARQNCPTFRLGGWVFKSVHRASVDAAHSSWRRTQLRASHLQQSQQLRNGHLGSEEGNHCIYHSAEKYSVLMGQLVFQKFTFMFLNTFDP